MSDLNLVTKAQGLPTDGSARTRHDNSSELQETKAALKEALGREQELLRDKAELLKHQELLAHEAEHRLINGLQLIVSLLSMQSRAASTAEASAQLTIAASRVSALARVHRRLHLLDHEKTVELKQYLEHLCEDLSGLLLQDGAGRAIVVTGAELKLPTALGIPLGFIVNELITNCVKYTDGDIEVEIESLPTGNTLSVSDCGVGLPGAFVPGKGSGLGMKIVQSLVQQVGGTLKFDAGEGGRGTRVTVSFPHPA